MKTFHKTLGEVLVMDWRVVVVLLPVIIAASWAGFNIAKAALGQIQTFLSKS